MVGRFEVGLASRSKSGESMVGWRRLDIMVVGVALGLAWKLEQGSRGWCA